MVEKQELTLEAVKLMGFGLALLVRFIIFIRAVLFLFIPSVLRLYHLENNKECSLRHCLVNGSWAWEWSRLINVGRSKAKLDALILDIANLETYEGVDSDSCIWSLSHDNIFSMNSAREHIDNHTLPSFSPSTRWCKVIPKKVNIFIWRLFLDRLPNRLNLSSRGLDIDLIACSVCNSSVESSIHAFSPLARLLLCGAVFTLGLVLRSRSFPLVTIGTSGCSLGMLQTLQEGPCLYDLHSYLLDPLAF
ncbi:RNA-directed DNA polymerase, eukaryota, reverse transcriptase zinc-binding domain protein [Tanacetum coccineum]